MSTNAKRRTVALAVFSVVSLVLSLLSLAGVVDEDVALSVASLAFVLAAGNLLSLHRSGNV